MTIYIKNPTDSVITIDDLGISIMPSESVLSTDYCNDIELAKSNDIVNKIALNLLTINNGIKDLSVSDAIRHITEHTISAITDISGKQRVHQTSRKLGLRVMWSGVGDSQDSVTKVGGGVPFIIEHTIGEAHPEDVYIDFNILENETWLHEGYITWSTCKMDTLTLEMVCRPTAVVPGSNTNYNLYKGYLIIPAAGNGTIEVTADLTHPNNGLIYIPDNDLGESPLAFWNADYNSDTKLYENISPAPYGNGRYNMFPTEIVFGRFVNTMPLLGSGFIALNSSDTDRMGHGMRLKMVATTNPNVDDHEWSIACLMCLHRESSV